MKRTAPSYDLPIRSGPVSGSSRAWPMGGSSVASSRLPEVFCRPLWLRSPLGVRFGTGRSPLIRPEIAPFTHTMPHRRTQRAMAEEMGPNFEDALDRIERIVEDLERGEPSLSTAL